MRDSFTAALTFVLQDEGGNDDDPADAGGRTSRGITQREYNAWCQLHGSPAGDVWKASDATVAAIYFQQYWQPYCDALPKGTDYLSFDANVLEGPVQSIKFLQEALGVAVDGHLGVVTMAAAQAANAKDLIGKVSDLKVAFYKEIEREHPQDVKFDRGWMNRVTNVKARALGMLQ
jgi:lysozyme family protein